MPARVHLPDGTTLILPRDQKIWETYYPRKPLDAAQEVEEKNNHTSKPPPPISREEALARIELRQDNLLELEVDAIVNPTSAELGFSGNIGQQLVERLGSRLEERLRGHSGPELGKAFAIAADPLPARYLILTSIEDVSSSHSVETVERGTVAALAKAESMDDVQTIAFPSLGTGAAHLNPIDVAPSVLMAVVTHLEQGNRLEKVIFTFVDEAPYQVYFNAHQLLRLRLRRTTYQLTLTPFPAPLSVAQRITLEVNLQPAPPDEDTFELPADIAELYCFITADSFQVRQSDVVTIPISLETDELPPAMFELQAHLIGTRTITVELFIEEPESGRVRIFRTSQEITVVAPEASEARPSILPPMEVRVAPPPDLVLRVVSYLPDGEAGARELTYYLSSRLPAWRGENEEVGRVLLYPEQLARMRALVARSLFEAHDCQPEERREQLLSLGCYLFDFLFPPTEARMFREVYEQVAEQVKSWLIIDDSSAGERDGVFWLPWQLVVPYDEEEDEPQLSFLGERYQLCRWIEGFGPPRYDEIPFGELALAHYGEQEEELKAWQRLLKAYEAVGISQVLKAETPVYTIHLRMPQKQMSQREIVLRDGDQSVSVMSLEEEVPLARLDLRLKRPVITLSHLDSPSPVSSGRGETDEWSIERLLPFLRAGASAVVAPWWPTSEQADQVFWATFHELLSQRIRLGEAVWRARLAVRRALPHRADWLAYSAFGEPRARAYWPEESEGYVVLECLNPETLPREEEREPGQESKFPSLRVGKTYYFRVSIRSRPPILYQERLIKAEALPDEVQALFIAPGLQSEPPTPIPLLPYGRTMRQATIELTPSTAGTYPLLVQLLEGDEHLRTLQLMLKVGASVSGRS